MYQSLVTFQYWTLVAQICNLFIQIFIFKKLLFKPVDDILARRKQEVEDLYQSAENTKSFAEKNKAEYEGKLLKAKEEADGILRDATAQAHKRSDEIISEANVRVNAMMQKADRDIEQERKKAVNDIKNDISDMAVEIASKIVEKEIQKEDHEKLINAFIDQLGDEA